MKIETIYQFKNQETGRIFYTDYYDSFLEAHSNRLINTFENAIFLQTRSNNFDNSYFFSKKKLKRVTENATRTKYYLIPKEDSSKSVIKNELHRGNKFFNRRRVFYLVLI